MKSEQIWKLVGAVITLIGGLIALKGGAERPFNVPLAIFGTVLTFGGKLLGERGSDWFDW